MSSILIKNATLVNEGTLYIGDLLIKDGRIAKIGQDIALACDEIIDGTGLHLLPGLIDDQVHFREPGLTHKGTIYSESKAAVAGGITSFMEMPNTIPNVFTQTLLEDKFKIAEKNSLANFSFFMGASNDNIEEVLKTDPQTVCGIKVFMGSSTGNMLVDNSETLAALFSKCKMLIATHCEDEATIQKNTAHYKEKYEENIPVACHPMIRSAEACYISSSLAVTLAKQHGTRLHVLHISTEKELSLFDNTIPLKEKKITAEACIHHLWFCDEDYAEKGMLIKWNPAIKTSKDRSAILAAVLDNRIDVIATDHAPHTLEEKGNSYLKAPSGAPLVQHALVTLLEMYHQKKISLEKIVEKTSHNVADIFQIKDRGFIKEGYWADLVLVDLNKPWTVAPSNILYQCGWSPLEGQRFSSSVCATFVNGNCVYREGSFNESIKGQRILFDRPAHAL